MLKINKKETVVVAVAVAVAAAVAAAAAAAVVIAIAVTVAAEVVAEVTVEIAAQVAAVSASAGAAAGAAAGAGVELAKVVTVIVPLLPQNNVESLSFNALVFPIHIIFSNPPQSKALPSPPRSPQCLHGVTAPLPCWRPLTIGRSPCPYATICAVLLQLHLSKPLMAMLSTTVAGSWRQLLYSLL